MKNTAIKEAIQKHLKKDNVDELQFYNSLLKDMEKLNTYRDMVVERQQASMSARNKAMVSPIDACDGTILRV